MSTYNLNSNNEITDQEVTNEEILYDETDEQNVEFLPTEVTTTKWECLRQMADEEMEELECGEYFEEEEFDEQDLDNVDDNEEEEDLDNADEEEEEDDATGLTVTEEENTETEIKQDFVEQPEEEKVIILETKLDKTEAKLFDNTKLPYSESLQESPSEIIPEGITKEPSETTQVVEKFYTNTKTEQILETQIEINAIIKSLKKFSKPATSTDKKPNKNLSSKPTLKSQKSTKIDLNPTKVEKLSNHRPNSQNKFKPKIPSKSHYNFDSLLSSSDFLTIDGALNLLNLFGTKGKKSEPETELLKGNNARSKSIDKNKPITTTRTNNTNNNNNNNPGKSKNSLPKRNSQTQRARTKGEWITRDTLLLRAKDDLVSVVPPTQGSWGFNAAAMWVDGYPATSGEHYWTIQFGSIGTSDFFAGGRCGVSSRDRMKALKARGLLYGGNQGNHGELTNGSKVLVKRFGRAVKSNDRIGILVSFFEDDQVLSPTTSGRSKNGSFSAPGSRNGSKVTSRSLLPSKSGRLSSSSGSTIQYQEDPIQGQRRLSVYFYHNGRCLGLGFRVPASLFPKGVYPMVQFNVENGSARIWKEPKGNIPPLSNRSPVPIKHRGIEGYWRAVGGAVKGADEELTQKFNEVLKRGRMTIDELNFPNNNNNNNNNESSSTSPKTKDKNREYKISVLLQKYRIIFFASKSPSAWTWTFSGYPLGRNGKSEGKTLKKVFKFPESVTLEPNPNGEKMSLVKGKFTVNFIRKDFTPFIGNSFREHEAV